MFRDLAARVTRTQNPLKLASEPSPIPPFPIPRHAPSEAKRTKNRVPAGLIAPTDTQMGDAEANGHRSEPAARPPSPAPAYNPAGVVSDLSAFVSLRHARTQSWLHGRLEFLIHLAIAQKLEGLQTTVLGAQARADHTQQVATSALKMASAAASASHTNA